MIDDDDDHDDDHLVKNVYDNYHHHHDSIDVGLMNVFDHFYLLACVFLNQIDYPFDFVYRLSAPYYAIENDDDYFYDFYFLMKMTMIVHTLMTWPDFDFDFGGHRL